MNFFSQGTVKTLEGSLKGLKSLDERTEDHQLSLLHLICAGHSEQVSPTI